MEIVYTDLIPAGASLKYNGKIYVGAGSQKEIEKDFEKKQKESA
jgi:hypothetical protein